MFMKFGIVTSLLAFVMLWGCTSTEKKPENHESEIHENQHKEEKILLLQNGYELFAEVHYHSEEYVITAHLTELQDYTPVVIDSPEWLIGGSSSSIKATMEPLRSGIYSARIKTDYEKTHVHGMRFRINGQLYEIKKRKNTASNEIHQHNDDIVFTKEAAWESGMGVKVLDFEPFSATLKTPGKIELAPGAVNKVTASIRGKVNFRIPDLMEGKQVTKGEILFNVIPSENTPENHSTALRKARKNLERAKEEYKRADYLYKEDIISENELLDAKLAKELASENYNALASGNSSYGVNITAPASGYIGNITIENGEHINTGALLCSVIHGENYILKADIPQQYYPEMKGVSSFQFHIPGQGFRSDKIQIEQENMILSKSLHSSYASASLPIESSTGLLPGAYAEIYFSLPAKTEQIVIPKTSLMEAEGNYYVYVMTGGESFEKRDVVTGQENRDQIVIKQGLQSGDILVTDGAYNLKLASMSGNLPSHNHDH
mgnify:CR=1 FL=1